MTKIGQRYTISSNFYRNDHGNVTTNQRNHTYSTYAIIRTQNFVHEFPFLKTFKCFGKTQRKSFISTIKKTLKHSKKLSETRQKYFDQHHLYFCFSINILKSQIGPMYAIDCGLKICLQYACTTQYIVSNSKASCISESVGFKKAYVRFLINKTF